MPRVDINYNYLPSDNTASPLATTSRYTLDLPREDINTASPLATTPRYNLDMDLQREFINYFYHPSPSDINDYQGGYFFYPESRRPTYEELDLIAAERSNSSIGTPVQDRYLGNMQTRDINADIIGILERHFDEATPDNYIERLNVAAEYVANPGYRSDRDITARRRLNTELKEHLEIKENELRILESNPIRELNNTINGVPVEGLEIEIDVDSSG